MLDLLFIGFVLGLKPLKAKKPVRWFFRFFKKNGSAMNELWAFVPGFERAIVEKRLKMPFLTRFC